MGAVPGDQLGLPGAARQRKTVGCERLEVRDVGPGNYGKYRVCFGGSSSSYMGIATGSSSWRPCKTRQLVTILAGFCHRRAPHTTSSLYEGLPLLSSSAFSSPSSHFSSGVN